MTREQAALVARALRLLAEAVELEHVHHDDDHDHDRDVRREEEPDAHRARVRQELKEHGLL